MRHESYFQAASAALDGAHEAHSAQRFTGKLPQERQRGLGDGGAVERDERLVARPCATRRGGHEEGKGRALANHAVRDTAVPSGHPLLGWR